MRRASSRGSGRSSPGPPNRWFARFAGSIGTLASHSPVLSWRKDSRSCGTASPALRWLTYVTASPPALRRSRQPTALFGPVEACIKSDRLRKWFKSPAQQQQLVDHLTEAKALRVNEERGLS